jgi:hypothetical protein
MRRPVVACAVLGALFSVVVCAPASALRGYAVTQQQGSEVTLSQISPAGARITVRARTCAGCRARVLSLTTLDNRRGRALVVDPVHCTYTLTTLRALSSQARSEASALSRAAVIPGLGVPAAPPPVRVRAAGRTRVAGADALGLLVLQGKLERRLWLASAVPAPASAGSLSATLGADGARAVARFLAGRRPGMLLRVEVRVRGRWQRELDTTRVVPVGSVPISLKPPRHYSARSAQARARTAEVPGQLNDFGVGPVSAHPEIWAIYWGRLFQGSPGTVAELNSKLARMVRGEDGYINGLAQYGVHAGTFKGYSVLEGDPPASVGGADFFSIETMLFFNLTGEAPRAWGRFSSTDPIIVIFVPESVVEHSGWAGYHFAIGTEQGGFPWNHLLVPWEIVKVPDRPTVDFGTAMVSASHEFVEAATDPFVFLSWTDSQHIPVWANGEASDICSQGNISPWGRSTRLAGTSYATYWSNEAGQCVPESRPSVQILAPAATAAPCGAVSLRAQAIDPVDGALPETRAGQPVYEWSDNGAAGLAQGINPTVHLSPGVHHLTVMVTDSAGLKSTSEAVTVTVAPPRPRVTLDAPGTGSTWGTDQHVQFAGSAVDGCDGPLAGASLSWHEGAVPLGTGGALGHKYGEGEHGSHTVTLTATNRAGLSSDATVSFTVGPPSGNPSPVIYLPAPGTNELSGATWVFEGAASDPKDGTLTGESLRWYDTYTDAAAHVHKEVLIGEGQLFTGSLYDGGFQTPHTITLIATDSLGHSASTSVEVSSGVEG